ncbi:hypothetical protein C8J57DRAFT_1280958 [Mycena rebaudengoi]|nr:hypothetical protein C8J57DRAFT_1280958 [Mycena rebaudengoi]
MDLTTKLKTPTCIRCRSRKIRCDGLGPCQSCSSSKTSCEYAGGEKSSRSVTELRKGAACLACRRKKKKCDGKLPCGTCLLSKKKLQCEYPDGIFIALSPGSDVSNSSSESVQPVLLPMHTEPSPVVPILPATVGSDLQTDLVTALERARMRDGYDLTRIHSPSPFYVSPDSSPNSSNYVETPESHDTFLEPTIASTDAASPDQLANSHLNMPLTADVDFSQLEVAGAFHMDNISPECIEKMDELARMRNLCLKHRILVGLNITDAKLWAISQGDTTGATVHPALVHTCQLTGYLLSRRLGQYLSPNTCEQENYHQTLVLDSLAELTANPSPTASLQTLPLLALYFMNKGDLPLSRQVLGRASDAVMETDLDLELVDFASSCVRPQRVTMIISPTTVVGENLAAFSQLVYLDMKFGVVKNLLSLLHPRLLESFKKLVDLPLTPNTEINFIRAKSVFFLREATKLTEEWRRTSLVERPAEWQSSYWRLLEDIDAHRAFLSSTLTKAAFCPELVMMKLALKVCAIMSLSALTELLEIFAQNEPDLMQKRNDAMVELIGISSTFLDSDCEYLDPIVAVCWARILELIDGCQSFGCQQYGCQHGDMAKFATKGMHDLTAMANVIRERQQRLHDLHPCTVASLPAVPVC